MNGSFEFNFVPIMDDPQTKEQKVYLFKKIKNTISDDEKRINTAYPTNLKMTQRLRTLQK